MAATGVMAVVTDMADMAVVTVVFCAPRVVLMNSGHRLAEARRMCDPVPGTEPLRA